jgi:hypothetical protein
MKLKWKSNIRTSGFTKGNHDVNKTIVIHKGDIVDCDSNGYMWYNGVCFGNKDSVLC